MDQNTNPIGGDAKVLPTLPTQPQTPMPDGRQAVQTLPEIKPTPVVEKKLEPAGFKPKLPDSKNLGQMGKWLTVIILGLSLLFFIATSVFYALDNGGGIENVRITNVTANSATISWTTEDEVIGRVIWDDENNFMPFIFESIGKNIGYDDRDLVQVDLNQYELYLDGEKNGYTHHVTLRNLKPNTEYFFKVGSTKRYFSFEQTSFKTFEVAEDILAPEPFYGKVSSAEFDVFPPTDGIVYYRVDIKGDGTQYSNYHSTTIDPESGYSADMGYLLDSSGKPVRANNASRLELEIKTDRGNVKHSTKVSDGVAPIMELEVIPAENNTLGIFKDVNALSWGDSKPVAKVKSVTGGNNSTTYKVEKSNGTNSSVTKIKASVSSEKPKEEKKQDKKEDKKPPTKNDTAKKDKSTSGAFVRPIPPANNNKPKKDKDSKVEAKIIKDKQTQKEEKSRSNVSKDKFTKDSYEIDPGVEEEEIRTEAEVDLTQNREEGQRCSGNFSCGSGQGRCQSCNGESWCYGNKVTCGNIEEIVRVNGGDVAYAEERIPELLELAQDGDPTTSVYEDFNNLLEVDNAFAPVRAWTNYVLDITSSITLPTGTAVTTTVDPGPIKSDDGGITGQICGKFYTAGGKVQKANQIKTKKAFICDYGSIGSTSYDSTGATTACSVDQDKNINKKCVKGDLTQGQIAVPVGVGDLPTCTGSTSNSKSTSHPNVCTPSGGNVPSFFCKGQIVGGICNPPATPSVPTSNLPQCATSGVNCSDATAATANCQDKGRLYNCVAITPAPLSECTNVTLDKCSQVDQADANCTFGGNYYTCTDVSSPSVNNSSFCNQNGWYDSITQCQTANNVTVMNESGECVQRSTGCVVLEEKENFCDNFDGAYNTISACEIVNGLGECERNSNGCVFPIASSINKNESLAEVLGANTTSDTTVTTGVYEITTGGGGKIELTITDENATVKYFIDSNSDGIKQENETEIDGQSLSVTLNKVEEVVEYNLNNGWNLLGFEIISENWDTASELITTLNIQGISVTHVATYSEGKWSTFSMREDEEGVIQTFGQDFEIIPGQGYFIRSKVAGTMTLQGNAFTSSVPINMSNGWNLLSVQSPTSYNAQDFLNKCVSGGVQCDSLARFDSGLYEIVVSQGGTFFGNNFNLIKKSGYFVRVVGGGGKQITP